MKRIMLDFVVALQMSYHMYVHTIGRTAMQYSVACCNFKIFIILLFRHFSSNAKLMVSGVRAQSEREKEEKLTLKENEKKRIKILREKSFP